MTKQTGTPSIAKRVVFATIPFLVLLLLAEVGLRLYYFQRRDSNPTAIQWAVKKARRIILVRKARHVVKRAQYPNHWVEQALFSGNENELLQVYQQQYEADFKALVEETAAIGSKLAMLYIPHRDYTQSPQLRVTRPYFLDLAERYDVEAIDVTPVFQRYPPTWVTLLPKDAHLSRFGNHLVAQEVSRYLEREREYRTSHTFSERPKLLGDLKPNKADVEHHHLQFPYWVVANSQGLRNAYDLTFPKTKQRVLMLGDSFGYGVYQPEHGAYVGMLDERYPDVEVINAGVPSYSIPDQLALFRERAKYTEPDITILQVLDNDLSGLIYFKRNQLGRDGRLHEPTALELEFLGRIDDARL